MQDRIDRAVQVERLADVVLDGLERLVVAKVSNVPGRAGHEVVDADDRPPVGEQPLAEVRPEEACPSGDDRPG